MLYMDNNAFVRTKHMWKIARKTKWTAAPPKVVLYMWILYTKSFLQINEYIIKYNFPYQVL